MSESLKRLRAGEYASGRSRDAICVCGGHLEVQLVVQIRERGSAPKTLATRSSRFCASCAIERMQIAFDIAQSAE